ncbi:MAG: response regulator [Deltaproteobacteria bacterium]|nr:response regulator [Deltaproteobacteria bacterium]
MPPNPEQAETKKTILVVDDDAQVQQLIRSYLNTEGFEVVTACDGNECMKILESHSPDLILLDLRMPHMNGIEVLEKLKKMKCSFPVIVVSSMGEQHSVKQAIALGSNDFIVKPFDLQLLRQKVDLQLMKHTVTEKMLDLSFRCLVQILQYFNSEHKQTTPIEGSQQLATENFETYRRTTATLDLLLLIHKSLPWPEVIHTKYPESRTKIRAYTRHNDRWDLIWPVENSGEMQKLWRVHLRLQLLEAISSKKSVSGSG